MLWVELPEGFDTLKLNRVLVEQGVQIAVGRSLSASGKYRNCLRMNYGAKPTPQIEEAVRKVGCRRDKDVGRVDRLTFRGKLPSYADNCPDLEAPPLMIRRLLPLFLLGALSLGGCATVSTAAHPQRRTAGCTVVVRPLDPGTGRALPGALRFPPAAQQQRSLHGPRRADP